MQKLPFRGQRRPDRIAPLPDINGQNRDQILVHPAPLQQADFARGCDAGWHRWPEYSHADGSGVGCAPALAGLRTVVFTPRTAPADLVRFSSHRVIGVAVTAREQDPALMDENLPETFAALKSRILQYKVCLTFDSAPETGAIGKATELGAQVVPPGWIPSIIGAPRLCRWQAFGNLFATAAGETHRIDRHPTMSRHPVPR